MAESEWVEVEKLARDEEAILVRGFLESEEIPCQLENRKFHAEPVNFGDMAVIRVLVPADRAEDARKLLARRRRQFETLERRGDDESILTDSGPARPDEESEKPGGGRR
jgi:Putative prokaryotic signal transducing protein